MKIIKGGITAGAGFLSAAIHCGIKKSKGKDLALIYSEKVAQAAGAFTANKIKAAPVLISKEQIKAQRAQAVIVNSGNANCCTGKRGIADGKRMIGEVAKALGISKKYVLIAGTGSIGSPLPIKRIIRGIRVIVKKLSKEGNRDTAEAILTTDTRTKEIAVRVPLKGGSIVISGIAKGSGMINPNLATMLAFITTDAKIKGRLLERVLLESVSKSFNMVNIDRCRSTNDTVLALANGMSNSEEIKEGSRPYKAFVQAFEYICTHLAKEIAKDGEGSTKLIEVRVINAKTKFDARRAAKFIVGSDLLKAAVFGRDPNYGRIMAALGHSAVQLKEDKIDVFLGKAQLVKNGIGINANKGKAKKVLGEKEVVITVDLKLGRESATAWGCDLTSEYVRINAKYHT